MRAGRLVGPGSTSWHRQHCKADVCSTRVSDHLHQQAPELDTGPAAKFGTKVGVAQGFGPEAFGITGATAVQDSGAQTIAWYI